MTAPVLVLDEAPGHLVRLAQQRHTQLWTAEFAGDLTGPQYAVVSAVGRRGEEFQRTVGERASLDKSSTADVVARLEGQGWLRLVRDPSDGRRKLVSLTPLARTALPELTRRASLVQQRLLEPVPEPARAAFVELMREVAYAGAPPSPREAPGVLPLRDTPGHLIRRSQQVHTALWSAEVGDALTSPQYALVSAVSARPEGVDQTAAGLLAGLDKSSTADVVRRLGRRGWIVRCRDPRDARCRLLHLTAAAGHDLAAVTSAVRRVQRRLLDPLVDDDRRDTWTAGYRALAGVSPSRQDAVSASARRTR